MGAVRKSLTILVAGLVVLVIAVAGAGANTPRPHHPDPQGIQRVETLEAYPQQTGESCPRRCQLTQYVVSDVATVASFRQAVRVKQPLVSDPRAGAWISLLETGPPRS